MGGKSWAKSGVRQETIFGHSGYAIARVKWLDAACACGVTRALAGRKLGLIEQKMADLAPMR